MKLNAIQELDQTVRFNLKRNPLDIGGNRLFLLLGILVFPLLLINAIFYSQIELRGLSLFLATGSSAVLLLILYKKAIQEKKKTDKILVIDSDEIQIIENDIIIAAIAIESARVKALKWGMEEGKELPAVSISGKKFPKLIIGSLAYQKAWNTTNDLIDTTDYVMTSNEEWESLFETLLGLSQIEKQVFKIPALAV